jgi:hypothetical protein
MIAKDSPLLIDCPPLKRGAISSAQSDLDAAINKFRMTAYMWQTLTAEDMRANGLGRRSFRPGRGMENRDIELRIPSGFVGVIC